MRIDDKPLPVEFMNENYSGDAVWVTQSSISGYFDFDRLKGKSVREAVVAVLTNTSRQHRGIATAIEQIIESRPNDLLAHRVTQTLWVRGDPGEAVRFYLSVFKDAYKDPNVAQHTEVLPGTDEPVTGVKFVIEGQAFVALRARREDDFGGGNALTLNCDTQEELDYYWEKLSAGGEKFRAGWIKDKFGLRWRIVPHDLDMMLGGKDRSVNKQRVIDVMLKMEKLDSGALFRAARPQ